MSEFKVTGVSFLPHVKVKLGKPVMVHSGLRSPLVAKKAGCIGNRKSIRGSWKFTVVCEGYSTSSRTRAVFYTQETHKKYNNVIFQHAFRAVQYNLPSAQQVVW